MVDEVKLVDGKLTFPLTAKWDTRFFCPGNKVVKVLSVLFSSSASLDGCDKKVHKRIYFQLHATKKKV